MSDATVYDGRHVDHIPFPVLIGDIGGTNARFALLTDMHAEMKQLPSVRTADHATIDDAIQVAVLDQTSLIPQSAILAVAGPIVGERVELTNCDWAVEPRKSVERFGLAEMILLNDFEAQSLALPGLEGRDLEPIGDGIRRPEAPRVVLGPGTGLGTGALVHARNIWVPVPGEGGHIDLGPVTTRDMAIWPNIERVLGRVSAETVLCGPGMLRLYRAICATDGISPTLTSPEAITAAGLSGADEQSIETLMLFATHLGRVAGDLALLFMAYGGVYLAGGISARIAPVLRSGAFRDAFDSKAPHDEIMRRMATAIIIKKDAPLSGIAAFARTPTRFGLELSGRRWRGEGARSQTRYR
jgi:glucokinase